MELLTSSDTRARCGECLRIFDALAHLHGSADSLLEQLPNAALSRHRDAIHEDGQLANIVDQADVGSLFNEDDLSEFDADMDSSLDVLAESLTAQAAHGDEDITILDVTFADFDLFSDAADLPELEYLDVDDENFVGQHSADGLKGSKSAALEAENEVRRPRDAAIGGSHQSSKPSDSTLGTRRQGGHRRRLTSAVGVELHDVDYATDQGPREPLVFEYRDQAPPQKPVDDSDTAGQSPEIVDIDVLPDHLSESSSAGPTLRWHHWLLLIFASVLLVSVVALSRSDFRVFLYNQPMTRAVAQAVCGVFPCTVPPRVNLGAIKAVSRSVASHPSAENALTVSVVLRNDADFAQPFPELIVRFTNRTGRLVASRRFAPNEYLDAWHPSDKMSISQIVPIRLDVTDPGENASSFELDFGIFQPKPTLSD